MAWHGTAWHGRNTKIDHDVARSTTQDCWKRAGSGARTVDAVLRVALKREHRLGQQVVQPLARARVEVVCEAIEVALQAARRAEQANLHLDDRHRLAARVRGGAAVVVLLVPARSPDCEPQRDGLAIAGRALRRSLSAPDNPTCPLLTKCFCLLLHEVKASSLQAPLLCEA
jgi:hypothetical protein